MTKTIDTVSLTVTQPKRYLVEIRGMDAIIFNKAPDLSHTKAEMSKQEKEDKLEVERRTWLEKSYQGADGVLYIPGENLHQCLKDACKYWGARIAGEGKKTYTDVVASAVVVENLDLGVKADSLIQFGKNVSVGSGMKKAMIYRIRPMLRPWGGTFIMHVFDGRLTPGVLQTILAYAGTFKGLCDWRPVYGRFELVGIKEI